jgi:hypothetical protein
MSDLQNGALFAGRYPIAKPKAAAVPIYSRE